ncbi:LINE-1 retrotransposable element ORF1 protein [Plecturocebus cupreus]
MAKGQQSGKARSPSPAGLYHKDWTERKVMPAILSNPFRHHTPAQTTVGPSALNEKKNAQTGWITLWIYNRHDLTLLPRLECSSMIIAYCSFKLLGSSHPLTSASQVVRTSGSAGPIPIRRTAIGSAEDRERAQLNPGRPSSVGKGRPPEGKLRNRKNFITNKSDVHSETQSESRQLQRRQVDKSTKMGRNQCKKAENTRNQNASPPTGDHSSSSAREQGLTEDECDELTESGFRRRIIRNFCELKEHVLTQCKETKNLERRFNEMLTRMDNLEKNISELMELKNTTQELHEACTNFNS